MRLSTIRIRNKKTGDVRKINEFEWARDLGTSRFVDWERMGQERRGEETKEDVREMQAEAQAQFDKKHTEEPVQVTSEQVASAPADEGIPKQPVNAGTGARRGRRK